jgi:hypothetical protein
LQACVSLTTTIGPGWTTAASGAHRSLPLSHEGNSLRFNTCPESQIRWGFFGYLTTCF